MKGDTKAIFTAASLATRAIDYLHGLQPASRLAPDNGTPSRPYDGIDINDAGTELSRGPR